MKIFIKYPKEEKKMPKCTICQSSELHADSPILVMGAYGVPKYLCDTCSADLDAATGERDFSLIEAAMERVGKRLADGKADKQTVEVVASVLERAGKRARAIKNGSYDFSLDECEACDGELSEIPEELLESEEDKELDRRDEEKQRQFDEFFKWVAIGAFIGIAGFIIYQIIVRFVL